MHRFRFCVVFALIVIQLLAGVSAMAATMRCDEALKKAAFAQSASTGADAQMQCHHAVMPHNAHPDTLKRHTQACDHCVFACQCALTFITLDNSAISLSDIPLTLRHVHGNNGAPRFIFSSPFRPPIKA